MSFLNTMLCYYFYVEAVLQGVAKNNRTEKQVDAEIQVTLKRLWRIQPENSQKGKCKIYLYIYDIFTNTFLTEHHRWFLFEYVFIWIIFCYF